MANPKIMATMPYDKTLDTLKFSGENGSGGGGITVVPVEITIEGNVYTYNFGLSFNDIKALIDNGLPIFTWSYAYTSGTYSEAKSGCALAGYLIENDNGTKQAMISFVPCPYSGFIGASDMIPEADWDEIIIKQIAY